MPSKLAQAIRAARLQVRLTQGQLGKRVGVKASAVQRWEAGRSKPPARRRPALENAITAFDPGAGAHLRAALYADSGIAVPDTAAGSEPAALAPLETAPGERSTLELLVYRMADELDLPPRRMRGALARLLRGWRAAGLSFEQAERELEAWLQRGA